VGVPPCAPLLHSKRRGRGGACCGSGCHWAQRACCSGFAHKLVTVACGLTDCHHGTGTSSLTVLASNCATATPSKLSHRRHSGIARVMRLLFV
jgi:hypothetical protein